MKITNAKSTGGKARPVTPPRKIVVPMSAKRPQPVYKGMPRSAIAVHEQRVDVKEFGAKALIGGVIVIAVTLLSLAVVTMRGESPDLVETPSMPFVETLPVVETAPVVSTDAPRPTAPVRTVRKTPAPPPAIVIVPELNLRHTHSFNAKTTGVKLRKGEKVAIRGRFVPAAGPAWLHIQRASGQKGWVLASTVQQKKARS